jgi:purine-binding chemotaxis protein CheW
MTDHENRVGSQGSEAARTETSFILPRNAVEREILAGRAAKLADPGSSSDEISVTISCLRFIIAKENYAIDMNRVTGAHPLVELTRIPCAPAFVKGILRVRGRIVSAIDLREFFGLPSVGITDLKKVIILSNEGMEVGILVDAVTGAAEIPLDDLQPANGSLTAINDLFLRGITRDRMVVINAEALLSHESLLVNEEVAL